jgi:hypothetical protein
MVDILKEAYVGQRQTEGGSRVDNTKARRQGSYRRTIGKMGDMGKDITLARHTGAVGQDPGMVDGRGGSGA